MHLNDANNKRKKLKEPGGRNKQECIFHSTMTHTLKSIKIRSTDISSLLSFRRSVAQFAHYRQHFVTKSNYPTKEKKGVGGGLGGLNAKVPGE